MKNSLISVSDKRGISDFAKALLNIGYEIYATEGTSKFLERNGLAVKRISELTGLSESKDLKTLHPEVFKRIYNGFFDLVVVNLYDPPEIDVGGAAILRACVKNYDKVLVVCRNEDYDEVLEKLKSGFDKRFRLKLAIRAMEYLVENGLKILEFLRS